MRYTWNASRDFQQRGSLQVIAITGCDGSGKSTLATSLVAELRRSGPVTQIYLGQSSGRIGEWIGGLPMIGPSVSRYLTRESEQVHNQESSETGTGTALVIYLLSCWRAYKFWRMLAKARRGVLVIADRYPQAEMPGFRFDGPQLPKTRGGNGFVRWLRGREQRLYEWMAARLPLLVIRLNVDPETAHARKPDHRLEVLREKNAVLPHLKFNGACILDLDSSQKINTILDTSLRAIVAAVRISRA